MTISYVQGAEPIWYIVGLDGLAAGGAQIFTYDSLTHQPRVTYQDPAGLIPNENPILVKANGTVANPIYFQINSADLTDLYFIQVFDINGTLLWEVNDYPSGASGGGSAVVYLDIVNYITNNQFIDHIQTVTPVPTNLLLCPSNHKGFTPATIPVVGTYGVLGPDIRFVKNNTAATDTISFVPFDLFDSPLVPDITPARYIRYQSNEASGETYKSFQFPITQKVKNLSNQLMTFSVWAAVTSTPVTINIYSRQYYGSGTAATPESTSTRVNQTPDGLTLSTTWTQYIVNFTMPDVSGNSLGTPGLQTDDDAVYIQIDMPLGVACDVLFTKPALFLGTIDPEKTFDSYDMIDSIDQTPRTGDVKTTYFGGTLAFSYGWVQMVDGITIGNTGSGAFYVGEHTYQLYKTLWDNIPDNTLVIVSGGRGATATADFLAGKKLQFPNTNSRPVASVGNNILGTFVAGQVSGNGADVSPGSGLLVISTTVATYMYLYIKL